MNLSIRNELYVTQMLFDSFNEEMTYKYVYDSSVETSDEEESEEPSDDKENENKNCDVCGFKGKTIGGLKTHVTKKHRQK